MIPEESSDDLAGPESGELPRRRYADVPMPECIVFISSVSEGQRLSVNHETELEIGRSCSRDPSLRSVFEYSRPQTEAARFDRYLQGQTVACEGNPPHSLLSC
jgi:hypothetical protein